MSKGTKLFADMELVYINTRDIDVDKEGQRSVERPDQINDILNDFNPNVVQPINVAFIEERHRYYCYDGQMTMTILVALNDGEDLEVPCLVRKGLTLDDCAELFLRQHGSVVSITAKERLMVRIAKGDVVSGGDEARRMIKTLALGGFDFEEIGAKASLDKIFQRRIQNDDEEGFNQLVRIMQVAWGDRVSIRGTVWKAVDNFMEMYNGKGNAASFNEELLAHVLSRRLPGDIWADAVAIYGKGVENVARYILILYNRDAKKSQQLPDYYA